MKTYRLSPAYYAALRERLLLTAVPIILAAGVVGYLAGLLQGGGAASVNTAIIFASLTIVFFIFTIPRSYRQQREMAESYQIILDGNTITRKQEGAQEISIPRSGIARITETPDKGLGIIGINTRLRFGIPATLEGYAELRKVLAGWHTIQPVKPRGMYWQAVAVPFLALALVGLFAVTIISNDKTLVSATGGLAVAISLASALVIYKNPQVDAKTKSRLWLISIPLLALAAKVIYTLVN
jgi:hypothetical protein